MNPVILGAVRHIVQVGAGALATRGIIDANGVELVVGAAVSAATLVWYLVDRRLKRA